MSGYILYLDCEYVCFVVYTYMMTILILVIYLVKIFGGLYSSLAYGMMKKKKILSRSRLNRLQADFEIDTPTTLMRISN